MPHPFSLSTADSQVTIAMNKLIRRLSRVSHSSHYSLLRSTSPSRSSPTVPEGCLPVYVGEEMQRFVVSADLLNHPLFINLLNKSAQEYGYQQKGVLRIPCHVLLFQRLLEALRLGEEASCDLQRLLSHDANCCSVDRMIS